MGFHHEGAAKLSGKDSSDLYLNEVVKVSNERDAEERIRALIINYCCYLCLLKYLIPHFA
jgi:hypothetical protein